MTLPDDDGLAEIYSAMEGAFSWVHYLPPGARRQLAAEIAAWRGTAEIYADPELLAAATRPLREAAERADPAKVARMLAHVEAQAAEVMPEIEEARRRRSALHAEIREGLAEAERGETVDLGSFAQYGDEQDGDGRA
jgi:predicted transcriptional regulator